jgi:gliding motility-associated lipoprotein GldH
MRINRLFSISILLSVLLISCDRNRIFEKECVKQNDKWVYSDTAVFDFEINDTLSFCNILLSLKNTNKYPYNNIWFFITTKFPDNHIICDTIDYILQNPRGEWFGIELGNVYGRYLPYRLNRPFPMKGRYKITVNQAMRTDTLEGIKTIGLRIEKNNKQKQAK